MKQCNLRCDGKSSAEQAPKHGLHVAVAASRLALCFILTTRLTRDDEAHSDDADRSSQLACSLPAPLYGPLPVAAHSWLAVSHHATSRLVLPFESGTHRAVALNCADDGTRWVGKGGNSARASSHVRGPSVRLLSVARSPGPLSPSVPRFVALFSSSFPSLRVLTHALPAFVLRINALGLRVWRRQRRARVPLAAALSPPRLVLLWPPLSPDRRASSARAPSRRAREPRRRRAASHGSVFAPRPRGLPVFPLARPVALGARFAARRRARHSEPGVRRTGSLRGH